MHTSFACDNRQTIMLAIYKSLQYHASEITDSVRCYASSICEKRFTMSVLCIQTYESKQEREVINVQTFHI